MQSVVSSLVYLDTSFLHDGKLRKGVSLGQKGSGDVTWAPAMIGRQVSCSSSTRLWVGKIEENSIVRFRFRRRDHSAGGLLSKRKSLVDCLLMEASSVLCYTGRRMPLSWLSKSYLYPLALISLIFPASVTSTMTKPTTISTDSTPLLFPKWGGRSSGRRSAGRY